MAITRKPARVAPPSGNVDVDDLIRRGGSAAEAREEQGGEIVPVILRLPAAMLRSIDGAVKSRPVRIPRHTWLLEAIHEKLQRETSEESR